MKLNEGEDQADHGKEDSLRKIRAEINTDEA